MRWDRTYHCFQSIPERSISVCSYVFCRDYGNSGWRFPNLLSFFRGGYNFNKEGFCLEPLKFLLQFCICLFLRGLLIIPYRLGFINLRKNRFHGKNYKSKYDTYNDFILHDVYPSV